MLSVPPPTIGPDSLSSVAVSTTQSASQQNLWNAPNVGEAYLEFASAAWYTQLTNALIQFTEIQAGNSVLDVASGSGSATRVLLDHVGPTGRVIGLEPAAEMIVTAATHCGSYSNIAFYRGTAENLQTSLPVGMQVDHVMAFNAVHLFDDLGQFIRSAAELLKPGGRLAFSSAFSNQAIVSDEMLQDYTNFFLKVIRSAIKEYRSEMQGFKPGSTARTINIPEVSDQMNRAGFLNVQFDLIATTITSSQLVGMLSLPGIIDTVLPNTIPTLARQAIIEQAAIASGVQSFQRNWLMLRGTKDFATT